MAVFPRYAAPLRRPNSSPARYEPQNRARTCYPRQIYISKPGEEGGEELGRLESRVNARRNWRCTGPRSNHPSPPLSLSSLLPAWKTEIIAGPPSLIFFFFSPARGQRTCNLLHLSSYPPFHPDIRSSSIHFDVYSIYIGLATIFKTTDNWRWKMGCLQQYQAEKIIEQATWTSSNNIKSWYSSKEGFVIYKFGGITKELSILNSYHPTERSILLSTLNN